MIEQAYNLNLIPDGVPVIVKVSQADSNTRTLKFNLYNGSELYQIPAGTEVEIVGTKEDSKFFVYYCSFEGHVVKAKVVQQMTSRKGDVTCKLRLTQNDGVDVLGTASFVMRVDRSALPDDSDLSETDVPMIEQVLTLAPQVEAWSASAESNAQNAAASQKAAKASETNAAKSQTAAKSSEDNALSSQKAAKASETKSKTSEDNAKISETNAANSRKAAKTSEDNAKTSETNAASSESEAKAWAVGPSGTGSGSDTNNAKYWAERARAAAGGAFTYQGTCKYADLPSSKSVGDVWNIEDEFIFDGHSYPPGTNVAWNGKEWDPQGGFIDTDTTPVQNSTKLITSGGVWTALKNWAASKLATARILMVNLGSATSESFDGSKNVDIGVKGTLAVAHGGTGATTAAEARTNLGAASASDVAKKLEAKSLTAAGGTLTWTDSSITVNSMIEPYATLFGITPSNVVTTAGKCEVTFDAQDAAFDVLITVRN